MLGELYLQRGRLNTAIAMFERAGALDLLADVGDKYLEYAAIASSTGTTDYSSHSVDISHGRVSVADGGESLTVTATFERAITLYKRAGKVERIEAAGDRLVAYVLLSFPPDDSYEWFAVALDAYAAAGTKKKLLGLARMHEFGLVSRERALPAYVAYGDEKELSRFGEKAMRDGYIGVALDAFELAGNRDRLDPGVLNSQADDLLGKGQFAVAVRVYRAAGNTQKLQEIGDAALAGKWEFASDYDRWRLALTAYQYAGDRAGLIRFADGLLARGADVENEVPIDYAREAYEAAAGLGGAAREQDSSTASGGT